MNIFYKVWIQSEFQSCFKSIWITHVGYKPIFKPSIIYIVICIVVVDIFFSKKWKKFYAQSTRKERILEITGSYPVFLQNYFFVHFWPLLAKKYPSSTLFILALSDFVALPRLMFRKSGGNSSFDYGRVLRFQIVLNQSILSLYQKQNFFLFFTWKYQFWLAHVDSGWLSFQIHREGIGF